MRFYVLRKTGYRSYQTLRFLYGYAVIAPRIFKQARHPVYLEVRSRSVRIPRPLLELLRPFNRYMPGMFQQHGFMPRAPWRRAAWVRAHGIDTPR